MKHVEEEAPLTIRVELTDNGKPFTDRFTVSQVGITSSMRRVRAMVLNIDWSSQAEPKNGMMERFNERISDVLTSRRYGSSDDLEQTLEHFFWLYNYYITQKALRYKAPIAAMNEWQLKRPELFTQTKINQAEPATKQNYTIFKSSHKICLLVFY